MKRATIFMRRGELVFDTKSRTRDGFWTSTNQARAVGIEDLDDIASALRVALDRSQVELPTRPPKTDLTGSLLAAARVKSWAAFTRGAKCVTASLENGTVTLTPQRRMQASYGDIPDKARAVRLQSADLGQAVLDSMADATT